MKNIISHLCLFLALTVVLLLTENLQVNAEQLRETYLSDLDWYSATHGDGDSSKSVQKDHPFTSGNNGEDTLISLLMEDGAEKQFEKGLGTVAASPSVITYNITDAGVCNFSCYVGLDRTANHTMDNHAQVEKIEIVVDDQVLYTTVQDYPEGIDYDTKAIHVELEIPYGAKYLELKSYAGNYTWGDEVVFADAKVTATGDFPEADEWEYYSYLSDLNWEQATHGDSDTSKSVQKNHPFTPGNNGQDTLISLRLEDDSLVEFEKGLGTVAAYPSTIEYDISGAEVSKFKAYVGIDQSANHAENHALIEKFEIVVDDQILYTSLDDYPSGISYTTPAVRMNLTIPEGSEKFELKAYAGDHTWGDEVVYADAKFVAKGEFADPDTFIPGEKRRQISNTSPLLMIPLYANGEAYSQTDREYGFWGDDTLTGKWESIPDDLKPYTVLELHPDDLPKEEGSAADFYEHFLQEAQNYKDPDTGESQPIPLVLTVYTAGNQSYYTAASWLTTDWIDEMYQKYSCLQGLFCTENYWVWASGIEAQAAKYLTISAKNGGYFIWSEQNNGASIEKALGSQGQTSFKESLEKYSDYFIFMYKNTPAGGGNDAPTSSYMTGLWLADYAYQWGGLMDTWKWYETGKWKLFESDCIGKSQENRQWMCQPEAMLGMEAMMIYLNGGCVYNFEHPAYTYGVQNEQSPLYSNVIQEFFRYVVENPAPSKSDILDSTKAIIHGNLSATGDGNFYVGLNTEMTQSPLYTTGRYGNIPWIPSTISLEKIESEIGEADIEIIESSDERLSTLEKRKELFNDLYPEEYIGTTFGQKLDNVWYLYNSKYNENTNQYAKVDLSVQDKTYTLNAELEPHTYAMFEEGQTGIEVYINNYRTDKDQLWEGASNAEEAAALTGKTKKEGLSWIYTNYINNTQDSIRRTTTITIENLDQAPTITNVQGLSGHYSSPSIEYNQDERTATITISCNGYVSFDITF